MAFRVARGPDARRAIRAGREAAGRGVPLTGSVSLSVDIDAEAVFTDLRQAVEEGDAELQDEGDLVAVYHTMADDRVRPEHAALHQTIWDLDDAGMPVPPLGHGCRCWIEYRARDAGSSARTGVPVVDPDPPEPGGEAFQRFLDTAQQVDGTEVRAGQVIGPRAGRLLEDGQITPDDVLTDLNEARNSSTLEAVAKARQEGRSVKRTLAAEERLRGLGIRPVEGRRIRSRAREIMEQDGLGEQEALERVLLDERPGFISARRQDATKRRARTAARWLRTAQGGPRPEPPAPKPVSDKTGARRLANALDRGDQGRVRSTLRNMLASDRLESKVRRAEGAGRYLVREDAQLPRALAYARPDTGEVVIRESQDRAARAGWREIAEGRTPTGEQAGAMRVQVHEELHGTGPMLPSAYTGIGREVEEATVEVLARARVRRIMAYDDRVGGELVDGRHPLALPFAAAAARPYDGLLRAVARAVADVTDLAPSVAYRMFERAAMRFRRRQTPIADPHRLAAAFAEDLAGELRAAGHEVEAGALAERLLRRMRERS